MIINYIVIIMIIIIIIARKHTQHDIHMYIQILPDHYVLKFLLIITIQLPIALLF